MSRGAQRDPAFGADVENEHALREDLDRSPRGCASADRDREHVHPRAGDERSADSLRRTHGKRDRPHSGWQRQSGTECGGLVGDAAGEHELSLGEWSPRDAPDRRGQVGECASGQRVRRQRHHREVLVGEGVERIEVAGGDDDGRTLRADVIKDAGQRAGREREGQKRTLSDHSPSAGERTTMLTAASTTSEAAAAASTTRRKRSP